MPANEKDNEISLLDSRKDDTRDKRERERKMHLIYTGNKRRTSHDQYNTCKDVLMAAKDSLHENDVEQRGGSNVSNTRTRVETLVRETTAVIGRASKRKETQRHRERERKTAAC